MAAVTPKAHGNATTPGTSTWTVTPTGTPVSGDLMAISLASDSTANLVSSVSNLGAGALVFSTTVGTGSATLILGVYNGSAPVLTLSSAWGANHGKLGWVLLDQTVYASWGTPGTVFNRSVSQSTTSAPSTGSSAAPNMAFFWDKTTSQSSCSTGITDIENVLPTSGFAGSLCISTYDDAAGVATQTATYGIASANGKGVQIPVVFAAVPVPATFAGSGTLSATVSEAISVTASLSATGTLAAATGAVATAGFSTTGTLGATVAPAGTASAAFSTAGTLAGVPTPHGSTAAAFSTAGTLSAHPAGPVDTFINPANWPMNLAHFGGDVDWPPGLVLHAYDQAARWDAALGFEVDVWPTTDGVWVVQHDNTTDTNFGTTGNVITSSTWASISSLTTTVGGYPIMRLDTLLAAYPTRAMMIDNKGQLSNTALLNLLDTYGGAANFIAKGFNTSTSWADAATARGYQTWGYYYDQTALASNQSHWSLLGMDSLAATSADWTAAKSYGKPVIAHIIATAAQKTTAVGFGANGFMASGVQEVIPQTPVPATFTGAGVLSAVPTPKVPVTAGLSASGTLAATATPRVPAVATLSASGTLAAGVTPQVSTTAALTGTGTLTAITSTGNIVAAPFNTVGTLGVAATAHMTVSAAFSSDMFLSATTQQNFATTAAFSVLGTLLIVNASNQRDITLAFTPLAPRWAFGPPPDRWQFDAAPARWAFTEGT